MLSLLSILGAVTFLRGITIKFNTVFKRKTRETIQFLLHLSIIN